MVYDTIIIGSGMAGLTASIYLARAKKNVMIIEDAVIGGITATLDSIENYPGYENVSGMQLVQNTFKQASKLGVNVDLMHIKKIDFDSKSIITDKTTLYYKTLIIASGTSYKKLNLTEEDRFKFRGLSYCAVCDGSLYKNRKIIVVTNGNAGAEAIEYLSNITQDIEIVDISDKYISNKFKVYNNTNVTKINGKEFVESIDVKLPNDKITNLICDGLFVCLGKETNLDLYKSKIITENGYICSDEDMHTNIDGVFVAGDIRKKTLRQIVTACSDGAIAATEAIKYIQNNNIN